MLEQVADLLNRETPVENPSPDGSLGDIEDLGRFWHGVETVQRHGRVLLQGSTPGRIKSGSPRWNPCPWGQSWCGWRHVDAVLGEPRADGFLTAERVRIDQELVRDEALSPTEADDQDAGPLIGARCRQGSAPEIRAVPLHACRCRLTSPVPG